jgi:hypothetical protein
MLPGFTFSISLPGSTTFSGSTFTLQGSAIGVVPGSGSSSFTLSFSLPFFFLSVSAWHGAEFPPVDAVVVLPDLGGSG